MAFRLTLSWPCPVSYLRCAFPCPVPLRPAVIKQSGVVIAPLRFSESTAKALAGQAGKGDKAKDRRPKVATVAGGMPRLGKQQ